MADRTTLMPVEEYFAISEKPYFEYLYGVLRQKAMPTLRQIEIEDPYPTKPIFHCIEILSPDDRFSDTVAKCEEYHAWGVPFCSIVDPEQKKCWEYHAGGRPHQISDDGHLTAQELVLSVPHIFTDF